MEENKIMSAQIAAQPGGQIGAIQSNSGVSLPPKTSCEHCCKCICHQNYKFSPLGPVMCYSATT